MCYKLHYSFHHSCCSCSHHKELIDYKNNSLFQCNYTNTCSKNHLIRHRLHCNFHQTYCNHNHHLMSYCSCNHHKELIGYKNNSQFQCNYTNTCSKNHSIHHKKHCSFHQTYCNHNHHLMSYCSCNL